jgi:dinuclear metal center YbgI/SA1388 family protein
MALLNKIVDYSNELLEIEKFSDYCPNGLQVEGKKEVKKLAVAVTASLNVINKAVAMKADALLVHHGFFWGKEQQVLKGVYKEKIQLLLKNNISLLAYHLPLDAHQELGNNWGAFIEMGFKNLEPFGFLSGQPLGVKAKCKPMDVKIFTSKLAKYYGQKPQVVVGGKRKIEKIGLISGGAHREIKQAIDEELDAYLTGTQDEPLWHIANEEKIHFFALGHSASEKIGPKRLGAHLSKAFKLKMQFIEEANPF